MRNILISFLLTPLSIVGVSGQVPTRAIGEYVKVPSISVMLVTASQPDSPVQIENSSLLNPVDGSRRAAFQYELRNSGTKPIRYVSIYALNSAGTGGGPLYNGHFFNKPLMPGKKISLGELSLNVTALTPELKTRLKLSGPLRVVVILLVERVEYSDGSSFTNRDTVRALGNYFIDINTEEINSKANTK